VYKLWHEFVKHIPKTARYTLGGKIDNLLLEIIKLIFNAQYLNTTEKIKFLQKTSVKLDTLKFFLQLSWEIKALDNKKYIILSEHSIEIGRMLGGWQKHLLNKTSPR